MSEKLTEEEWKEYSPYCPICDSCGEDGCCPATSCQQHPDGHYCGGYLNDLKFGYKMYHKPYWVYDKKTGKIKGFDKWKDAVKYDKLLNQNNDE